MVAFVILGILLAVGVPSFLKSIRDSRRSSVTNEILASLQSARGESMKQSRDAYVCPTTNGTACSTTASDWSSGWMVWVDLNRDSTFNSPGELIRYQANDSSGVTITTNATGAKIRYRPFQVVTGTTAVVVCDPRGGTEHRSVIVETGRPRIATGDTTGLCP